jgi:hypothetical protein
MLHQPNVTRCARPSGTQTKKFKGRFEFISLPFAVAAAAFTGATRSSS